MIIHTDECTMAANSAKQLEEAVSKLVSKFKITYEGEVDAYLGVKVEYRDDGS